jgi:hypothetical protein
VSKWRLVMRAVVTCDADGRIETIATVFNEGIEISVPVASGKHRFVLEIDELTDTSDNLAIESRFREIRNNSRIDLATGSLSSRY